MKIKVYFDGRIGSTTRDISRATDKATLRVSDISFSENERVLTIPITRHVTTMHKQKWVFWTRRNYERKETRTRILIRNVEKYAINEDGGTNPAEITILFGIQVDEKSVYLSSAEERKGVPLLQIHVMTSDTDIEVE